MTGLVVVTGAGGFVGSALCSALREAGVPVRALVRRAGSAPSSAEECVVPELERGRALDDALRGAQAVVHLAARVHQMDERTADRMSAYRQANVDGTRAVLDAASTAGARSFVFASSVKAVGERSDAPWTESVEPRPLDPYGVSKLEGERVVLAARALRAVVLRLPLVYGPGVRANMLKLFRVIERGVPLPVGGVKNRRSLLFVGNLVSAITRAIESERVRGTYFLSDGPGQSTEDLARAIGRALGKPARVVPLPVPLLKVAGRVGDALRPYWRAPVTSAAVSRLLGSLEVDSSRFRSDASWHPPFTLDEGLRRTAEWYRTSGEHA